MNELQTKEDRRRDLIPASHVFESSGTVEVRIEMPGVSKDDLEIRVEGQEIQVRGRRPTPTVEGSWLVRERSTGDFSRTFSVDGTIDLEKIGAKLTDGVLALNLPMKEASKPRRIDIKMA